jgi:hypothetical protein
MISGIRARAFLASLFFLPFLGLFSTRIAGGEPQDQSPSTLIKLLSDRKESFLFSCGETEQDRADVAAAKSLAKLGAPALPEIEQTLDSLEQDGLQSKFEPTAGLLLFAYARIKGAEAYPRQQSMLGNRKLAFLQSALDASIAVSFNLTSYVSFREWTGLPTGSGAICGRAEPRHVLNWLILAWEGNDRLLLEASLGPAAKATLNSMLKARTWDETRADFWRSGSDGVAVGYRFDAPPRWSEPAMNPEAKGGPEDLGQDAASPELDTLFKGASGHDCGWHRVKFVTASGPLPRYLVDDSDIGGLLRLISSCAAGPK